MSNAKIDDLLESYDEKDDDKFKELIKNYLSYAVDNEVLKLANNIVKSDEWLKSLNAHKKQVAPPPATVSHLARYDAVEPLNVNIELEPQQAKETSHAFKNNELSNEIEQIEAEREYNASNNQHVKETKEDEEEEFDLR